MDPSPLIFVGLAIAWGAYLIPKALEHHDAGERSRTISTFSERIRVLARREAVSRRRSTLVATKATNGGEGVETGGTGVTIEDPRPVEVLIDNSGESILETTQSGRLHLPSEWSSARRPGATELSAAGVAARRRRRVLGVLVFLFAATAAVAAGHVISWLWLIAPALVIVAWLVACRMMVTGERATRSTRAGVAEGHRRPQGASVAVVTDPVGALDEDDTASIPAVPAEPEAGPVASAAPTWEPVHAPLPTYVTKDAAPRRAITIDLDSTGVWTSGNTDADSALAREADAARATVEQAEIKRASGA